LLIEAGTDVNAQDDPGHTVLMYASGAKLPYGSSDINPEVVLLLLVAGADVPWEFLLCLRNSKQKHRML
jgi:hypothetical protein